MFELRVFLLCGVLASTSGQFFHSSSGIKLQGSGWNSSFGFALGYQDALSRLVVGAPRQDSVGKVYDCPLSNLTSPNIICSAFGMSSLNLYENDKARTKKNPNTMYSFGSSIAASSNFFVTCAPLLTKMFSIKRDGTQYNYLGTYGGCFVNHNSSVFNQLFDNSNKAHAHNNPKPGFVGFPLKETYARNYEGGFGWNMLLDEDYLLMSKPSERVDILYRNIDLVLNYTHSTKSLLTDKFNEKRLTQLMFYYDMGYGLAVGYFFNKTEKLYAVSTSTSTNGLIFFLKANKTSGFFDILSDGSFRHCNIDNDKMGSMFGYAMAATDINQDGLSELLVGAPAEYRDVLYEFGALHIYIGGDMDSRNDGKRMLTIMADKINGRFGSAIATADIDGDGISEVFVSAPYEGYGAVYALSGFELKKQLLKNVAIVQLSSLKLTQRLEGDGGFQLFGFSLQVVKDLDKNGCDELAIGSPASSTVKLVRCLPAINTSLTLELLGDPVVKVNAKNFIVQVCMSVSVTAKCQSAVGEIGVNSIATGNTKITTPTITHKIEAKKTEPICQNITVDLLAASEQTDYTFTTTLNMTHIKDDPSPKVYKHWAVFSPYSETEKTIIVRRYCSSEYCKPNLSYQMIWSGKDALDVTKTKTMNETLMFMITNTGNDAYHVMMNLTVKGASVQPGACYKNNYEVDLYTCALENVLKNGTTYNMSVPLYVAEPTNNPSVDISVAMFDAVFPDRVVAKKSTIVRFDLNPDEITVNGTIQQIELTEKDLEDTFIQTHYSYTIMNTGPVTWNNLNAVLRVENDCIKNIKILPHICIPNNDPRDKSKWIYDCPLTIKPESKTTIEVSIELTTDENTINKIKKSGGLNIVSDFKFNLSPLSVEKKSPSSTKIIYQILSMGNNKWLIILIVLIVAILLLIILIIVLYKRGFFKRGKKKQLNELRTSIRKRSVRLASARSGRPSAADGEHCDIEVIDDNAFHEVDISQGQSKDNIDLIQECPEESSQTKP